MALLEHLYGLLSLRQTHRDIEVNVAYRWFLGYDPLENIPHLTTLSYAFYKRLPSELSEDIFAHILSKAPGMVFRSYIHKRLSGVWK